MFRFFTMALLLAASNISLGQSPNTEAPTRLIGFFTPGMGVGIQSIEGSSNVIVHTYTDANFAVEKQIQINGRDLGSIDAAKFATQSEPVRTALEQHLKKLDAADASERKIWLMPLIRTTLGRVKAIGDNYILIEIEGDEKPRMVIAELSISKIYLNATPIRFISTPSRNVSTKGG